MKNLLVGPLFLPTTWGVFLTKNDYDQLYRTRHGISHYESIWK